MVRLHGDKFNWQEPREPCVGWILMQMGQSVQASPSLRCDLHLPQGNACSLHLEKSGWWRISKRMSEARWRYCCSWSGLFSLLASQINQISDHFYTDV